MSYLRAGLCVLPAIIAEKRPALSGWKQYQKRLPTERQVRTWFAEDAPLCVLAGSVSGQLEMIDFDHGGELFEQWRELVTAESAGLIERLVIERSQSGGRHVVYRSAVAIPSNRKLAQRTLLAPSAEPLVIAGKRYVPRKVGDLYEVTCTLIETRGEGGLFLCAPSPGYQLEQGTFESLPVLTEAERMILVEAACALNEAIPQAERHRASSAANGRPGDDFNERGDIREVLRRHGWELVRGGENEHWRRPGKELGWSATLKDRVLFVFSSNAAPFEPDRAYAPFTVYALLDHNGDWRHEKRLLSVSKSRAQLEADCVRAAVTTGLDEGVSACRVRTDTTMLVRNCDQSLAASLKTDGYWESFYTLACRRLIQPGWHCVDVGANYGYYATLFAQLVGRSGRIMALEPNPAIYSLLVETLRINALDCPFEILPIAAADQPGEMPLWTAEDNSGNASFIRHIAAHGAEPQVVAVDTLDHLLAPWHRVDLIKIDAEGAEELIWTGMEQTLARGCRVMMEVQMSRYADPQAFWRRIKERFPLPCFLDYDGLVKPVPEYQLFEGAHHDWMLWLTPSRESSTL